MAAESPEDKRPPSISERFAISRAVNEDDVDSLKKFILEGIDVLGIVEGGDTSILHKAASKGSNKVVTELLSWGAQIEALDWIKMTPLHHAASTGQVETVVLLVSSGANVNAMTESWNTPLNLAIQERRSEVISYFLNDCKMDINELDKYWQDEIKDIFREAEVRKMQEMAEKQKEQLKLSETKQQATETNSEQTRTPIAVVETPSLLAALLAQRPQTDQLNRIVVPRIATYWREVGTHLHTDPSMLEEIHQNSSSDPTETCERTLQHWLDTDKKASWTTLLSTLELLQLTQVLKDIQSEIAELPINSSHQSEQLPSEEQTTESWSWCNIL